MRLTKEESDAIGLHKGRHRVVVLITLAAFLLSSWLTAKGLLEKAIEAGTADVTGMITAVMSAGVGAALIGGATMMLMGIAVNTSKKQILPVAGLAVTLMPFVFGISTFYAVIANAGAPSLVYDMRDKARDYVLFFEQSTEDAEQALSAKATLLPLESSICGLAHSEKIGGTLTGSAGKGAVYAAYESSCQSVKTVIQTLDETAQRTAERREQGSNLLNDLKAIPSNTSLSVFERQAEFKQKAQQLRKLITESSAENVTKRLTAQLKNMSASVNALDIQSGSFGQSQASAVQTLRKSLAQVSQIAEGMLSTANTSNLQAPGELLEMGAAVLVYWQRNLPQILLAVLLDCMNLWFLGLLMTSRAMLPIRVNKTNPKKAVKKGKKS